MGMEKDITQSIRINEMLYRVARLFFSIYIVVRFRVYIYGQEHLPSSGPVIILPKHQRWTDIPLVGLAVPYVCHYIAKRELFMMPVIRYIMTGLGGIPLDRQQPIKSRDTFKYLEFLLQHRQAIVLFPEGTYFPDRMGPGKYRLIQKFLVLQKQLPANNQRTLLPFIPMGITYGKERLRPRVQIMIGQPMYCRHSDTAQRFTENIMANIAQLSGI